MNGQISATQSYVAVRTSPLYITVLPHLSEHHKSTIEEMEANHKNDGVSPFVMKTYQMVNDPTTDDLIGWSKDNNSFIVADHLELSRIILPSYFKHNNFSSFVRQLNTYGFKKVDPDKWEFANQWFLRGQKHLLKNVSRRKQTRNSYIQFKCEDEDEEQLATEIAKLNEEQIALQTQIQSINKRIQATEKRPQQMISFLYKILENPQVFPRIMLQNRRIRRRVVPPATETGVFFDNVALSSPETTLWWNGSGGVSSPLTPDSGGGLSDCIALSPPESSSSVYGFGGGRDSYMAEMVAGDGPSPPLPYPFTLFSDGF